MPSGRRSVPEVIYSGRRYVDDIPPFLESARGRLGTARRPQENPRLLDVGRARPMTVTAISARDDDATARGKAAPTRGG